MVDDDEDEDDDDDNDCDDDMVDDRYPLSHGTIEY